MKATGVLLAFVVAVLTISLVSGRPTKNQNQSLSRQKRQSDQRLAELETLLALQKYGRHRLRMDRKKGVGADGEHPPGYGIIDFRMLGRKKKSTSFSPGEFESKLQELEENQRRLISSNEDNPYPQLSLSESSVDRDSPRDDPYLYIEKKK